MLIARHPPDPARRHATFRTGMTILTVPRDPRRYQIVVLSTLLAFGVGVLDFGIDLMTALTILVGAQLVQYAGTRIARLPHFDPASALITSLSLTLLLRTDVLWVAALAPVIAVGSKFVLRVRGKHVFNPANIALVTLMLASERAWVSTGQWGSAATGAFALACLGFIVLTRAKRAETTFAFIVSYATLLFARAAWLGDPIAIPIHQLQSGALLIFAFFMISDPKTAPDSAVGRILFGIAVALVAFVIRFAHYEPNAPILALILCAPTVPLIDAVLTGATYRWTQPGAPRATLKEGVEQ